MKCVFLAYHDIKSEARSQDMIELLKKYGETITVSYGEAYDNQGVTSISNPGGQKGIVRFLRNCKRIIKTEKPDIILLHDDYPLLYVNYIRKHLPNTIIIHDSSELYLVNERIHNNTWKKKIAHILRYVELRNTKKADIVIAANKERAELMVPYFKLSEVPLVFENIHRNDTTYNEEECRNKYSSLFKNFTVIYAGGVAEERLTYKMASQIGRLGNNYQLIIVGAAEVGGKQKLDDLIEREKISNVHYLGFVNREELKYLMENSSVSISAFAMDVVNNINCASGKVYEGLFLGKPLLAGINPSLKSLCEKYEVGVSTDDFAEGLIKISQNYEFYSKNVREFIYNLHYEDRIDELKKSIDAKIIQLTETQKRKEHVKD